MKNFLLVIAMALSLCFSQNSIAQTTITATSTGTVYYADGGGAFVFAIRNTNANPVVIKQFSNYTETSLTANYSLWYKPTPLTGVPGNITAAAGWKQITAPYTLPVGQPTGMTLMFSGLNFVIPANTTYRFAIVGENGPSPYYATSLSGANIFSGGGVDILSQDNATSPGYGQAIIASTGNTPRGFLGSIVVDNVAACTGTPTGGTAVVFPGGTTCGGSTVSLTLVDHSYETGTSYLWKFSPTIGGTYTAVTGSLASPLTSVVTTTSGFYRCDVTCGANTVTSTPIAVNVTAPLAGNVNYTIDNTLPTGGLNFASFTAAFNALGCGVAGKVVFNVASGQTFNENPPELNATGTITDSIIFKKAGSGPNPLIRPATAGTIASSTTLASNGDGVVVINGGDYITFDGIDINTDNFTTGNDRFEYGYYLKKKSATDACKNVSIKNANITLAPATLLSYGVFVSNNSGTATVTPTSTGGRSENIKISGNYISGSYGGILIRGYSASTPYDLYDQGLEIGVDSGNTITAYGGGSTATYGMYVYAQNNFKIAKNRIENNATGQSTTLYGLYTNTCTNSSGDIYNNTISSLNANASTLYCLYNDAGSTGTNNTIKIYNNIISNNTTTSSIYPLYQTATPYSLEIYNNSIIDNTVPSGTGTIYGIYATGAVVNQSKIYNNTVANNSKTGTTGTMYGIYSSAATTGSTSSIYNNNIHSLVNTSTSTGSIFGLVVNSGGPTVNVYNNFISDLNTPTSTNTAATTTDLVRGISVTSTTATSTINVSFNTILLNAVSSGANFSASGIFHTTSATATTATLNLRNNIVVNTSTAAGTGFVSAIRRSTAALTNFGSSTSNNDYYVNPGTNQVIFYDGTNNDADLAAYKGRVSPRESGSVSENPNFINGASAPYDLHINTTVATQIESGGIAISGITTDIDGNVRNATTPDMGADEFAGIGADLSGPSITYTALPVKSICVDGKTITATITDASGVNVAAGTKPRLWFKKATENDALPATNTSASNGWKYVEASNAVSPFIFNFNFNLLSSPLINGDSVSYFVVAQDLAGTPNVGVSVATFTSTPATVALGAGAFPTSGSIRGFSILTQPNPITIKVNQTELCVSGIVTLNIDGVDVTGGEYQWQSSHHNTNTWSDISGATTIPYTTAALTDSTDFRLVVKCGGTPISSSPSTIVTVNVNNPAITSTTPASRCGTGTVNLQATGNGGINWYAAATGGTAIGTGSPFTTPTISTNTTFYVSAGTGGSTQTSDIRTPNVTTTTTDAGLTFDLNVDATMNSVDVFTNGSSGDVVIGLFNSSNTLMYTSPTFNVPSGNYTTPYTCVLNWVIAAGTNYKIKVISHVPQLGYSSGSFPIQLGNGVGTVTNGALGATTSTLNYFIYNIKTTVGCEGSRVPVLASVTAAPLLTVSPNKAICAGVTDSLEIISGAADYTSYVWSPLTDLYTNAAATIPYAGGNATKVYVKGSAPGKTGYTLTANNSGTSCANIKYDTIVVLPAPTITATPAEICLSGTTTLVLSPATDYSYGTIQWQSSTNGVSYNDIIGANGTSYTTPTLTSTTYYKALIKGSNGIACSQPTITVTVNTPTITGTTPGMNCGPGSVVLQATGNSGSTLNWYAASTGGSPIGTGSPFNTPSISTTTTYYVSASQGGGLGTGARATPFATSTGFNGNDYGLMFEATQAFTLVSVDVYPTTASAGSVVLELLNSAGTVINTAGPFAIPVATGTTFGGGATPVTLTLNFPIAIGSNYKLRTASHTGSLVRDNPITAVFTYPVPLGTVGNITAGWLAGASSTGAYYYFYNWSITTGCSSARTAVVATIDNTPGCTMPVTLLNFTGEKRGNYNKLLWSTATEINNSGFELQRSTDGVNFSKVIFVNSKAANGNSSSVLTYSFDDVQPLKGNNYYRLKQVDKDGRATITNIVLIKGDKVTAVQLLSVYPNPVKNNINLKVEAPAVQHATLIITDAMGKVIMQQQANLTAGGNKLQMPTAALAQGTYFIKVTCANGCQTAVHKFIKE